MSTSTASTAPTRTAPSVVCVDPIIEGRDVGHIFFPADSSGQDIRRAIIAFFRQQGHHVYVVQCTSEADYIARHPDAPSALNNINDFPSDLIEEARSILRATETSPVASVAASSVDVAASVPPSPRRGPAASFMWLGEYVSNTLLLLSSSRAQNSSPVPSSSSRSDPSGTLHRSDAPQGHANVTTRRSGDQGSIPSRRPDPDGRTSPIAIANATTRRTSPPSSIHTHSSLGPDASSHHMGGTVHPYHPTSHHIHHNMGGVYPPPTRPYFHSYLGQNMGGTSSPYHLNNNNNIGQSMGGTTYPPHHNNNYYYSGSSHPLPSGYMHTSSHHNMGGDAPSTLDGMSSSGSSVYPPSVITQPSSTSGSSSDPPPSSAPSPAPAPGTFQF